MPYDEMEEDYFDFLPEWEQCYFHLMNCPSFQVGYYEKDIEQKFIH